MSGRPPLAVLDGVRVLGFTQFLLGPSGVQFLADLGADVVKIEPPGGTLWERNWSGCDLYKNGVSVFYMSTHRSQRSLAVDLKHPDGQAVARRLIEGADVLVQNRPRYLLRGGGKARSGLGRRRSRILRRELSALGAPLALRSGAGLAARDEIRHEDYVSSRERYGARYVPPVHFPIAPSYIARGRHRERGRRLRA